MKIFIVHGYTAGVNSHWFPWLTEQFSQKNHTVSIVELPNSQTPVREDWLDTLSSTINVPDDETIIVTHSLGGYTTLRYLTDLTQDWSLLGLILVSGFLGKLAAIPEGSDQVFGLRFYAACAAWFIVSYSVGVSLPSLCCFLLRL